MSRYRIIFQNVEGDILKTLTRLRWIVPFFIDCSLWVFENMNELCYDNF
jgi:hypothetical protein